MCVYVGTGRVVGTRVLFPDSLSECSTGTVRGRVWSVGRFSGKGLDSLSGYPVVTTRVGTRSVRRNVDTGSGLFVGTPTGTVCPEIERLVDTRVRTRVPCRDVWWRPPVRGPVNSSGRGRRTRILCRGIPLGRGRLYGGSVSLSVRRHNVRVLFRDTGAGRL